ERLHRAAVEDPALDRASLEDSALCRLELVEPRGEQRLDRAWHGDLAVARLLHQRDRLLDEERVAFGRPADSRLDVWVGRGLASRSSPSSAAGGTCCSTSITGQYVMPSP